MSIVSIFEYQQDNIHTLSDELYESTVAEIREDLLNVIDCPNGVTTARFYTDPDKTFVMTITPDFFQVMLYEGEAKGDIVFYSKKDGDTYVTPIYEPGPWRVRVRLLTAKEEDE